MESLRAGTIDSFVPYARRHQLAGFLYALLKRRGTPAAVPTEVLEGLERRYRVESRKRRILRAELAGVLDAFSGANVDCMVIKGPELAGRYYGSDDARLYWDLDVLVRQADVGNADRVLRDAGFARTSPMLFGERVSHAVAHAVDYGKGEAGLDLHWKFSQHPAFRIDYRRAWERRESWLIEDRACTVLSDDYALTLNLLSSFKDIERGAFRLRSFVDLWMILGAATVDWTRFFEERREENVDVICSGVLALFVHAFDATNQFPELAAALAREPGAGRVAGRSHALQIIGPGWVGPSRRLWAARMYQISPARHATWWALSLPVRLNVHKPGKTRRLMRSMREWLRHPR